MRSNLKFFKILPCILIIIFAFIRTHVESKGQYVQPLVMGMQAAIPYDIANIWNRPVSFSPVLSTILGVSLLYILFFGVITAPFGYMFGVPSQKYVVGTSSTSDSLVSVLLNNVDTWKNYTKAQEAEDEKENNGQGSSSDQSDIPRSFSESYAKPILRQILGFQWDYPEFTERIFSFIPDDVLEDEVCQQLILCHSHNSLQSLPDLTAPFLRIFSKTLTNVPKNHRKAIKLGLSGGECGKVFKECPSDIYSLALRILLGGLPSWLRKGLVLPQF